MHARPVACTDNFRDCICALSDCNTDRYTNRRINLTVLFGARRSGGVGGVHSGGGIAAEVTTTGHTLRALDSDQPGKRPRTTIPSYSDIIAQ